MNILPKTIIPRDLDGMPHADMPYEEFRAYKPDTDLWIRPAAERKRLSQLGGHNLLPHELQLHINASAPARLDAVCKIIDACRELPKMRETLSTLMFQTEDPKTRFIRQPGIVALPRHGNIANTAYLMDEIGQIFNTFKFKKEVPQMPYVLAAVNGLFHVTQGNHRLKQLDQEYREKFDPTTNYALLRSNSQETARQLVDYENQILRNLGSQVVASSLLKPAKN